MARSTALNTRAYWEMGNSAFMVKPNARTAVEAECQWSQTRSPLLLSDKSKWAKFGEVQYNMGYTKLRSLGLGGNLPDAYASLRLDSLCQGLCHAPSLRPIILESTAEADGSVPIGMFSAP